MAWAPFIGHGTVINAAGIAGSVTSISIDGIQCPMDDVTAMNTNTAKVFLAGLVDPGTVKVDGFLDPTAIPAIANASGAFAITFSDPDTTGWTFNGFITSISATVENETSAKSSYTIKLTGPIALAGA
jgi:hypothetical protein